LAAKITKNLDSPPGFAYQDAMIRRRLPWFAVALVLGTALGLMWMPMRDDTATMDETVFLGAGYSYWQGHRYYLNPEHPPLMQLWSALPLLYLDVNLPTDAAVFFHEQFFRNASVTWKYDPEPHADLPPAPEGFYHYPAIEAGLFGRVLVYDSHNDADTLLFWGRFMQALVTLATGVLVFRWAKSLSNVNGGLLALTAWAFNPLALAYGHLIITDPGIALMLPLAVWMFSRFLESPRPQTALPAGLAFGGALLTKYTAIILIPIFGLLALVAWWRLWRSTREESARRIFVNLCLFVVVAWGTVLLLYVPHWSPPPALLVEDAQRLQVPAWFTSLRWLLIPRDFFKGFTIMLIHVFGGHDSYLLGHWSETGWWYYYPVAILVKTPVALLLLLASAVVMALRRMRQYSFAKATPLIAAAVYLACAITSRANIGIRHVLPIYPLLAVVAGIEYGRAQPLTRFAGWLLAAWLAVAAFAARSDYLAYFNELVGGPAHGQDYLLDSNFDWGQSGKRLKEWMAKNHVAHIYLDYFGTGAAIEHLQIPNQRVKAAQARELSGGYLVVSATNLMSPEYDWLRASHAPVARIGNTLFVYSLPLPSKPPPR
jgi:4-amino-4-deoxy-L-arabinose transferase-like glycosyltransferase